MVVVFIIIGLLIALLGALIWRFRLVSLLSNVDKTKIIDKTGLARWAGKCILTLAGFILCEGILLEFVETDRGELIVCMLFMFTTQMIAVVYLSGLQRYTK